MKISLEQSDLQNAIEKAEKLIHKNTLEVLDSVLLSAKNDKITLTANNLVSAIIIDLDGNIIESGSVLIDKSNFKLIKKLKDRLHISSENNIVKISGNRELKFTQLDCEFPEVKTETNDALPVGFFTFSN
jgi:DNA polymerase-3 subunit beta